LRRLKATGQGGDGAQIILHDYRFSIVTFFKALLTSTKFKEAIEAKGEKRQVNIAFLVVLSSTQAGIICPLLGSDCCSRF
jgi:hypothetical protein